MSSQHVFSMENTNFARMKQTHALFLDIDGTLVSFNTHEIPASTIHALTLAKANGHRIYIATGRPFSIISNVDAIKHLVDGYITTNGAHCLIQGKTIYYLPIPDSDVQAVLQDARANDYSLIVVSEHYFVAFQPHEDVDRIFRHELNIKQLNVDEPWQPALQEPILQFCPFFPVEHEPLIAPKIPNCVCQGRWHPEFTDITARQADKGRALEIMARHEGIDLSHTIAFGDGGNDMSMILKAGIGVAMGNAIAPLKQAAQYVTSSVDDNGIPNALKHFGII